MRILALDLSKSSTGWAFWERGTDNAKHGTKVLGSEMTTNGATYIKLHTWLSEMHLVFQFDAIYFEQTVTPDHLRGHTNAETLLLLAGLSEHTKSFAEAYGIRLIKSVKPDDWLKFYCGRSMRFQKRKLRKQYSMERSRQLGFNPRRDDEADALGILDYACELNGITPPWRQNEILRPPFKVAGA